MCVLRKFTPKLLTAKKSKRWIWWTRCLSRRKPKINSVIRTREPWNHLENEITVILRNNNFEIYVLNLNKLRLVLYLIKYILRLVLLIAEADKVGPIEVKSSIYFHYIHALYRSHTTVWRISFLFTFPIRSPLGHFGSNLTLHRKQKKTIG